MGIRPMEFWNLEKMGIPVVEYTNPILGSIRDLYEKPGGPLDVEWMRKYGKIFGVYEGRDPTVCICEPELVRLICVKDQEYFNSKREFDFGDPLLNEFLESLPYDKWKIVRNLSTPAFSSAKVKMMNMPMREATQDFVSDLKEQIKEGKGICEKFAIDQAIHTMLTDLISRAFFSVQVADRKNKSNEFAKIVTELLTPGEHVVNQVLIIRSLPCIPMPSRSSGNSYNKNSSSPSRFDDLSSYSSTCWTCVGNPVKNGEMSWTCALTGGTGSPEFEQAKVTELTLLCQAVVFFVASQDQISTMVASIIFHMTKDPELERRIYEEVDEAFAKNNGKIEHEHLSGLTLLNACVNESLRLYAVFHRTDRVCTKDWKNEEFNLEFKKGTNIIIPIWALNRCEEFNENPDEFVPDRFMPENKDKLNPYSSTAFGFGPRNCTGKRFAMEAMPLILVYLLKELKFKGRKDTEIKFVTGGLSGSTPHEPIYVDIEQRKDSKLGAPSY